MSAIDSDQWASSSELIWGRVGPSADTLTRWLQGFQFSETEPTALVQLRGGPCAVVTAVQAHMLRLALFEHGCRRPQDFDGEPMDLLTEALAGVMQLLAVASGRGVCLLAFPRETDSCTGQSPDTQWSSLDEISQQLVTTEIAVDADLLGSMILSVLPALCGPLGFLSIVYSSVLTLGPEKVRQQVADDEECLIDPRSGNGSQALLNLLIAGVATPHFFDGVRNVDGLFMQGITEQPGIGFLTLLEALRYCEVGWHLKNPRYPVWIVGSETHLTIVCSDEAGLIQTDGRYHEVDRAFQRMDTSGAGFIPADKLDDLLKSAQLSLPPDCPKLSDLLSRLDPEGLQIILRDSFLHCYFPNAQPAYPSKFSLYHLNNLVKGANSRVAYISGRATIAMLGESASSKQSSQQTQRHRQDNEDADEDLDGLEQHQQTSHCDLMRVLHTKWPTLGVIWDNGQLPSVY